MSQNLTLDEFPPVSTAQWDAVVRQDLKGAAPKAKLFYRAEDLRGLEYLNSTPGEFPYTRGARPDNAWKIRQAVPDAAAGRKALDAGADEIRLVLGSAPIEEVVESAPFDRCAVHFEAGERAVELLDALVRERRAELRGSVDFEPLADFDRAVELVRASASPQFRPVTIAGHRFAEAGAAIVQELAFTLAEGVEMVAQFTERGMAPADAAAALCFSFSAGSKYFSEIAKLRAARMLWARAIESFQPAAPDACMMTVCVRTAHSNKTIYDAHVNLLRATTEAMAAVIGGADSVETGEFDAAYREPDEFGRRLARDTQLILKQEALLDRSVDPAGGSYYLESLTDSLAREAWKLFQQIEAAGGFLAHKASGALDASIAKSRDELDTAVATRRASIVGTNQYPNAAERMLPKIEREDTGPRAARIFEEIRLRTERHAARTGHTPRFVLLEAGDLKMRKARSGFISNFFGCAGFETQIAETLTDGADAIVLCSSDSEFAGLAPRVIAELRAAGKSTPVIVAGNPDSIDELKQAGVADFIHIRSNAVETLRAWQERLGVAD